MITKRKLAERLDAAAKSLTDEAVALRGLIQQTNSDLAELRADHEHLAKQIRVSERKNR